ncbi:MAG: DUF4956 domain-containing protein [Vicinamibacterales bacterium]
MPEFLTAPFQSEVPAAPFSILVRLSIALGLGMVVALVYRLTRARHEVSPTFPVTLTLLAVLIAMVTQVIGDNVARAFSLVGALSIVRFRTVVRDTQDTAYVIFAVAVGMAVGASNTWVAVIGIPVVALAAVVVRRIGGTDALADLPYALDVRLGIGHDLQDHVSAVIDAHVRAKRVVSLATARQGMTIETTYRVALRDDMSADALVRALNRLEGVQGVSLATAPGPQEL